MKRKTCCKPLPREDRIRRAALNLAISEIAGIASTASHHFAFWRLEGDSEAQAQVLALASQMTGGSCGKAN